MNTVTARKQVVAPSQWGAALARYKVAHEINQRYFKEVYGPCADAERAFEEQHGLEHGQPAYVERRKALEQMHGYRMPRSVEETADRLCNEACAAEDALMEMPAPDLAALRFKLEKLLAADDGSTDGWSADYVRQTQEDIRRLLP
ncbi:hypothetical protein KUV75_09465 [Qipengyuania gaetbuli]|uniref:hypothetical protein n=1 Tax=Qipengyuania gaetbuli TaxID=266952 RepID=UPI001C990807|nr:hypothetical protein [Qipengyuania gaetbuli]MBY6015125.1 hypothetical protein [Qipengyuania gaetbuli]